MACLKALLAAYEDAGVRGLCAQGRWEVAVAAVRDIDLGSVLEAHAKAFVVNARRAGTLSDAGPASFSPSSGCDQTRPAARASTAA
jgi:hypothetical protein